MLPEQVDNFIWHEIRDAYNARYNETVPAAVVAYIATLVDTIFPDINMNIAFHIIRRRVYHAWEQGA